MFEKQKQTRVEKPWGYEILWAETPQYAAKILFVKKGESLSLQYHETKEETLFLDSGECSLEVGQSQDSLKCYVLKPGDSIHIPAGCIHRLVASADCRFFEVSTPHLTDVVRLKDKYGRV